MKSQFTKAIQLCCFLLLLFNLSFSQSTGYINRPATTPAGRLILNPNSDNYTSATSAGFLGNDVANSELPYRSIPSFSAEPFGDLRRGPSHLYSDFVPDANNVGYYTYFDGTNLLFRFRMGSVMPGSKGYSVLLDTDGKFGATGATADPDYQAATTGTNGNPGFEIEIVLETNSRIAIYNVAGSNTATLIKPYTNWQDMSQVSVAGTFDNGDPDFFIDFYIPYSDLTASPFLLSTTSSIRMSGTTVMSPQAAIGGPKSDIYGLNDAGYKTANAQYEAYINAQPSFTPASLTTGGLGAMCTEAPTVTSPISTGTVNISGTWTKSGLTGAVSTADITVYKNSTTVLGTVLNVSSGATWTLNGVSVASGNIITAKAQASGESMCLVSNAVTASTCNTSTRPALPALSCYTTTKGITGTNLSTGWTVYVNNLTVSGSTYNNVTNTTTATFGTTTTGTSPNINWTFSSGCSAGSPMTPGSYKVYYTDNISGCTSEPAYVCVQGNGGGALASPALASPVITTPSNSLFTTGTTSIIGTTDANSTLALYINGTNVQNTTASSGGAFTFSNLNLITGQQLYIVTELNTGTVSSSKCAAQTTTATVTCFTSAPLINTDNNNQITAGQPITGISSEPTGTTIRVYTSAPALVSTVTVQSGGTWTTGSYTAVAGTTYYTTAQNGSCGVSMASGNTTAATATTGRCGTITGPVSSSSSPIAGTLTGSVASTTVNLYQDGSLIGSVVTATNAWSISAGSLTYPLYSGGILTIGVKEGTNQEQACPSSSTTVTCSTGPATPNVTPPNSSVTPGGTQTYTIDNAVIGAFYGLANSATGASLGTGVWASSTTVTLTTNTLPAGSYNVAVKGTSLSGVSVCGSSPSMATLLVSSALPLTLLHFSAQKSDALVLLSWRTERESHTSHFEIEKCEDGRDFLKIGRTAAYNKPNKNDYQFKDEHPLANNYYRLKMFDDNGKYTYSNVIAVAYENLISAGVQPNPFIGDIHIYLKLATPQLVMADLTDMNGRVMISKSFNGEKGNNHLLLPEGKNLSPGFYIIRIANAQTLILQQKMIKVAN